MRGEHEPEHWREVGEYDSPSACMGCLMWGIAVALCVGYIWSVW